jgi:hypothetical protein
LGYELKNYFSPNTEGRYVESDGKAIVMARATTRIKTKGMIPFEILSSGRFAIFAIT